MKFEISEEWVAKMANLEEKQEIAMDVLAQRTHSSHLKTHATIPENIKNYSFGKLISFMRRESNMTLETLSNTASIKLDELLEIEADADFRPEPRTVFQLAQAFKLPVKSLLQVAGLAQPQNDAFFDQAIKFAARSNPLVQLTPEEKVALHEYVTFLSAQK